MTPEQRSLALEHRDRIIEGHRERREMLLEEIDARLRSMARARSDSIVDADDAHDILRDLCNEPPWEGPVPDDTRFLGGLWRGDDWTNTGRYKTSRRPECNGRRIPQFKLTED